MEQKLGMEDYSTQKEQKIEKLRNKRFRALWVQLLFLLQLAFVPFVVKN